MLRCRNNARSSIRLAFIEVSRYSSHNIYGKSINQITNRRIAGGNRWPDQETGRANLGSSRGSGLQERQELLHDSRAGQDCSGESQSSHGSQSRHRRDHHDCSQARGQVARRQGRQRRNSGRQEVAGIHIVFREGGGEILRLLIYRAGRGQVGTVNRRAAMNITSPALSNSTRNEEKQDTITAIGKRAALENRYRLYSNLEHWQ